MGINTFGLFYEIRQAELQGKGGV